MDQGFTLSPAQGIQILCLAALIKGGDLVIEGSADAESAKKLIVDVAQEIALQVPTTRTEGEDHDQ